MKFAIIETGSKQYKVAQGDTILVEKLEGKEGEKVNFDKVLLLVSGKKIEIGRPLLKGVTVSGKLLSQGKGKKVRVATYEAKSRYRRVKGHRQQISKVKIQSISSKTQRKTRKKQSSQQP